MGYRRLFIMRKDLKMSPGKLSAQVSHCAEAFWTRLIRGMAVEQCSPERTDTTEIHGFIPTDLFNQYIDGSFVKTICEARNKNHLMKAVEIAKSLGLGEQEDFGLIYDKCLTELTPEEDNGTTLTGIWFAPLPDNIAHAISKNYHLYT